MATEREKILRILDANANRAREGLRVVEDYCRFVLDDAELSSAIKRMRHDVTDQMNAMGTASALLEARDSESDVGASEPEPTAQPAVADVVMANIKRAQEALRCLEDYSKALDAARSEMFKKIRFELYALEKKLLPLLSEPQIS
jgi:thiamine-phosphate pyrophosphorylase